MRWYDIFSSGYDRSLEALYRPHRLRAMLALGVAPGSTVLDLACGTGQNFDLLMGALGTQGRLIGVDASKGMLDQARKRVAAAGWTNVSLVHEDARHLEPKRHDDGSLAPFVDFAICTLGFSVIPDWETAFQRSFDLLRPGGRYVILDVFAEKRTLQTRLVEFTARARLTRKTWLPLQLACPAFKLDYLDASAATFGGKLFVACGTKPSAASALSH